MFVHDVSCFLFCFLFWGRRHPRTLTAVTDITGYKLFTTLRSCLTWPCSASQSWKKGHSYSSSIHPSVSFVANPINVSSVPPSSSVHSKRCSPWTLLPICGSSNSRVVKSPNTSALHRYTNVAPNVGWQWPWPCPPTSAKHSSSFAKA